MAIADVYDALLSKRVYKEPMTFQATVEIVKSSAGNHFDPTLAKIVVENIDLFQQVHTRFKAD